MTSSGRQGQATPVKATALQAISHAALVEGFANHAVKAVEIVEFAQGTYRLEVSLSWKAGKSVLTAARGEKRDFRSLDTVVSYLLSAGVGATAVKLTLKGRQR
jgi:hypothetical protein